MTVLYPEGFGLSATTLEGDWQDTLCMPFTVASFDNILSTSFEVNWSPSGLQFIEVNPTGAWPGLTFDENSTDVGSLSGSFSNATSLAITDDEVVFEVCFQLIADPENCYNVTISDTPTPPVTTDNGPGNIIITNGEICILDAIVIDSIAITPVSCPGSNDGAVEIFIREWPGQGFIGTTWNTQPFAQFTPLMVDNLSAGPLSFTIFDSNNGTSLTDTIMIPTAGAAPEAVILGEEIQPLPCDPPVLLLQGTGSTGTDYVYNWYYNNAIGMPASSGMTRFANETGNWILQVINSESGCAAYDTVTVVPSEPPVANTRASAYSASGCG